MCYILAFPLVFISRLLSNPVPSGFKLVTCSAGCRVDCLSGCPQEGGRCVLLRTTVQLGRFTAALRSVLLGGEGPRGTTVFGSKPQSE